MKYARGFSEATLDMFLGAAVPMGDMVTGGKVSGAGDSIADRAAAMRIACEESAEFFAAVEAAGRKVEAGEMSMDSIRSIVSEAKDVKEATKLLADPRATVMLDGIATTADDDAPDTGGTGDGDGDGDTGDGGTGDTGGTGDRDPDVQGG